MPVLIERLTVEQFAVLPESETEFRELHNGEVVYMSAPKKRHSETTGAPDFMVEVMSPSNSRAEMLEREELCLANGCHEFWTMYPEERRIRVATPSQVLIYDPTDMIACSLFPGWSAKVSELFA
ncbi:MAG: Uma2 family endonuclease [Bryobacteraceae bacterium]|nr:Uma2 family endonuclease [Bryobacteraceae bacterium]